MRTFTRVTIALMIVAGLLPFDASAQNKAGARSRAIVNKNYEDGKTDGLRILIYKVEAGHLAPVDPSREFRQGDDIKVAFESNFAGYVYFVNVSPGGKSRVIFPFTGESDNVVRSRQRYELPRSGVLAFDEEKGVETLQVIMSKERIQVLDDAVKNSNGELGSSAASAAAELSSNGKSAKGGLVSENIAVALPQTGARTRGVKLSPGRDRDEKGSLVYIPDTKGKGGNLKSGEIAVFEIRLKHV